ncbi:exodeoxyribonuclease V subunit alpha [Psychrosphaera sp. B3R10]|uniref:exodeoxyribonuclease V subunit alpha n=1 Tax=unclassified Psychrosphaera TaxID=2641570 RepID=UPI001C0A3D27|nr:MULTISPECIES: exodeoxyribonuclease V subunit alpha [unclassified Psychrosphaera]MBU2882227.1 exodeoxyribonuclease V subunit alpha [Psychrosphaera sp. I2R16]MBU2988908.1 exodeoxyribonuclease V subunit alpha [Psychrosphaera sp. B3R10]
MNFLLRTNSNTLINDNGSFMEIGSTDKSILKFDQTPVAHLLTELVANGKIESVCKHFANMIFDEHLSQNKQTEGDSSRNLLTILAAFVMDAMLKQHSCIYIDRKIISSWLAISDILELNIVLPDHQIWLDTVRGETDFVQNIDDISSLSTAQQVIKPFVLWQNRFYLHRYFIAEHCIANKITKMLGRAPKLSNNKLESADEDQAENNITPRTLGFIESMFKRSDENKENDNVVDWQKVAVTNALQSQFSVISGGPGTGKTTTVVKLLAGILFDHQILGGKGKLKIAITAPTGKAALRLEESIKGALGSLDIEDELAAQVPVSASTVHRLMGSRGNGQFKHDHNNLLRLDILLIDEASMIDVTLMAKVFNALPLNCRVILIGDRQQLASVEAGNVLADFYIAQNQLSLRYLVELKKSFRFGAESSIGQLAAAINVGDFNSVNATFLADTANEQSLNWYRQPHAEIDKVVELVTEHYSNIHRLAATLTIENEAKLIPEVFKTLYQLQVLCCVRKSEFGTESLNRRVHRRLIQKSLVPNKEQHYVGRPIMIATNAYNLKLYNGDIGIQLIDPVSGLLMTYFQVGKSAFSKFHCQRLPGHESVYSMTVHKSQGSEFDHSILILPAEDESSSLVSREIVYTGLTRSKINFSLLATETSLRSAINRTTHRYSGLAEMLVNQLS